AASTSSRLAAVAATTARLVSWRAPPGRADARSLPMFPPGCEKLVLLEQTLGSTNAACSFSGAESRVPLGLAAGSGVLTPDPAARTGGVRRAQRAVGGQETWRRRGQVWVHGARRPRHTRIGTPWASLSMSRWLSTLATWAQWANSGASSFGSKRTATTVA